MKQLMYYSNDPNQEQMVWLVWKMENGRPTLVVICTTNEDLARYVTPDRKMLLGRNDVQVLCEKTMCDHLFGGRDSSIAMKLLLREV